MKNQGFYEGWRFQWRITVSMAHVQKVELQKVEWQKVEWQKVEQSKGRTTKR